MNFWFESIAVRPRKSRIEDFRYPASGGDRLSDATAVDDGKPDPRIAQTAHLAEVVAARAEGIREGRSQAAAESERALAEQRQAVASALAEFAQQRTAYFAAIEIEAARLVMAISRHVLHREARADPLLLAGTIRVALDQIQAGSRMVLRTAPETAMRWGEICEAHCQGRISVEVVGDNEIGPYHCRLETEVGHTDISLEGELHEIEKGFFDRLPSPAPRPE